MGVTYIGNCNFEPTGPGVWGLDNLGLDTLTVPYKGRSDKQDEFIDGLRLNSQHPVWKGLGARRIVSDNDPVFATVSVEFAGFRSAKPRPPVAKSTTSLQTVQGTATIQGEGKCSIEAMFYAPVTEWDWFELFKEPDPDTPIYSQVKTKKANPLSSIIRWRVTKDDGSIANTVDIGAVTAALNSLRPALIVQEYTSEEVVPGFVWHCHSSILLTLLGS